MVSPHVECGDTIIPLGSILSPRPEDRWLEDALQIRKLVQRLSFAQIKVNLQLYHGSDEMHQWIIQHSGATLLVYLLVILLSTIFLSTAVNLFSMRDRVMYPSIKMLS